MVRLVVRRWSSLLVLGLLLSALVPPVALAQPDPGDSTSPSDSLCDGSTTADYAGPCGPSLTVPNWGDAAGWDQATYAGSITLFDLDGDGKDELIGRGPHGLFVNTWSNDWGQWVPANLLENSDGSAVGFAFPDGAVTDGTIRYGQLTDGQWGVVGLASDGSGLETWSWNPGSGSQDGVWTLENQGGPFGDNDPNTLWYDTPYYSTIQFVPTALDGAGYSLIARGSDGIHLCSWGGGSWSCKLATSAFNDTVMYNSDDTAVAPYFYDTIQFGDIYSGADGVELFGRDSQGGGTLKVYTWDSGSQQFTELKPSGNWPFWSPYNDNEWDNISYSSTIQPVQLIAQGGPQQVIGRSRVGLQWFTIADSGCGSNSAPCWKSLTNNPSQLYSDYNGFGDPQYYSTIRFADLDGDGLDETFARTPDGTLHTYALHKSAGWSQVAGDLSLTAGPADDPLWSDPGYYQTLTTGVVTDDDRATLIARGKYGVRTWMYWTNSGWSRPYVYGFQQGDQAQANALALVNRYLNIDSNHSVRDSYTSVNSEVFDNYSTCLSDSIAAGATMPPTVFCHLTPPKGALTNSSGVTASDWQAIVAQLQVEMALAGDVDSHFHGSIAAILSELFLFQNADLDTIESQLFPKPPDKSKNISAALYNLFIGVSEGIATAASPELNVPLHIISGVVGAMQSLQTPSNSANTFQLTIEGLQAKIVSSADEATKRNGDLFAYVVQDRGLLYLYGSLISNQYWEIQTDQHNAAISSGEYSNATWIYQALLPLDWQVWVCPNFGLDQSGCDGLGLDIGTNAMIVDSGDNWRAFVGKLGTMEAINPDDATFSKVFDDISSSCQVGGPTDGQNWTYDGCNLGTDILTVLYFEDGWTTFACMVWNNVNNYNCGHGDPQGYGPPGS